MAIKELFWDERPVVLFDPKASGRIDPRFKFTRNSRASYFDENGLLRVMAAQVDQPRVERIDSANSGLLLERSTTNIFPVSNTFAAKTACPVPAPDGSTTAIFASLKPPTGFDVLYNGSISFTANKYYCVSMWVYHEKGSTHAFFANPQQTFFNFTSASVTLNENSAPSGVWTRIYYTFFAGASATTQNRVYREADTTYWAFGRQIEEVAGPTLGPSSYIETTGSQVTRAADLLSVEKSLPSTGSVYIDARSKDAFVGSTLISLKNDSNQKIDLAFLSNANTFNSTALLANYNGTNKATLPLPVPTTNRERNIVTWGSQNYQYGRDGSRFASSLSTSVPSGLNSLSIGSDSVDPTKAFNGYINNVYVWNGELTPAIAEALIRNEVEAINADTFSPVGPAGALSLVINTQGAAADGNKVFTLPAESALNDNDIVITWGDNTESGLAGAAAELGAAGLAHTYPAAGIYPVYVEGKLQNLFFNNSADAKDLLEISAWGTTTGGNNVFLAPSTMNSAFYGCSKLQSIPSTNLPNTSAVTDWFRAFRDCSSLTGTFRSFNFSAATTFQEAFYNCSGITSFTAAGDQTQNVTNFSSAWYGCSGLTSFPLINTSSGTNFSQAWRLCSGLTSFPLINTASATNLNNAWQNCSSLTSFPLINTANVTSFAVTWNTCSSLTSFPLINTSSGTNFSSAWGNCFNLTSFPLINTSSGTDFSQAWFVCGSLTSFPLIDTSSGGNFFNSWNGCSSLTSFPALNTSSATNFSRAIRGCSSLTSFPSLNFDAVIGSAADGSTTFTGFKETWQNCTSLTTFPANLFDNTTCTRYLDAFTNCALTAASIENIIVSINAAGTSNGNLSLQGGTNAGASTWTANAVTAYDALVARGWTITRNA